MGFVRDYPRYPNHPRAPYYYPGSGHPSSGLPERRVKRIPIIAAGTQSGTVLLDGAGVVLLNVLADVPMWFRLYATDADRDDDAARGVDTLPPTTAVILDVLFESPDDLDVRLWNFDAEGILAFNRDDPAKAQLYYRVDADVDADLSLYYNDLTGSAESLADVENVTYEGYTGNPTTCRYRQDTWGAYVVNSGADGYLCRFDDETFTHPGMAIHSWMERSSFDTSSIIAMHCYYVSDSLRPDLDEHLRVGIVRNSSTNVVGQVDWVNSSGSATTIITGSVTCPLGLSDYIEFRTSIVETDDGVVASVYYYDDVGAEWIELVSAVVPSAVSASGNEHIGIYMEASTVPEANLAWGGISMHNITVLPAGHYIDVAYVPIEKDGGSLVNPP